LSPRIWLAYGSLIVVESVIWFSVLTIIGGIGGLGGSPIFWPVLAIVFALGTYSGWVFGGSRADAVTVAAFQAVLAIVVVYMTVSLSAINADFRMYMVWPVDMFGGTFDAAQVVEIVIALATVVLVWFRTQTIISDGDVRWRLRKSFKIGILFLAAALVTDLNVAAHTGITSVLVPFFIASLVGLASARLNETEDSGNASWPILIAGSVLLIMVIGVIAGLLTGRYGNVGVRGILNVWGALVDAVLWVLRYPIEWVMTALWAFLTWLKERSEPVEETGESVAPAAGNEFLDEEAQEQVEIFSDFAVDALRWPLSILLLVVLFIVLVYAYKRFSSRIGDIENTDRESINVEDNSGNLMNLLGGLLPGWMRGNDRAQWRHPTGEQGITEAFLLYFDTLTHAIKRGMRFNPNATPNERTEALAVFLPGAPVGVVTSIFNDACYGSMATDIEEINRLREQVERAASTPKPDESGETAN